MPKARKERFTANQFDIAMMEEITHARGMNVSVNMVSNAAMFAMMIRKRLFGKEAKMSATVSAVVTRLMEDAKAERAEYELRRQEEAKRAERQVLMPGDPRFNPRGN